MPPQFFPTKIEILSSVENGTAVPIANGSQATWAIDASGRQWVRKHEINTGFQPLLAEAASALLGEKLKVRQPASAVFSDDKGWSWMSKRITNAREHWEPDMRDLIANPNEVGRMLALDALTFNEDRHKQNILVEPHDNGANLRLWAIDSGNALIGWPGDYIHRHLKVPSVKNHARGLPVEVLRDAAIAAAQVASQLPDEIVKSIIFEACKLAGEPRFEDLSTALLLRCRNAVQIVNNYIDALGALP